MPKTNVSVKKTESTAKQPASVKPSVKITDKIQPKPVTKVVPQKKKIIPAQQPASDPEPDQVDDTASGKSPKKKPLPTFKFDGELSEIEEQFEEMLKDMDETQKKVNSEFTRYKHFVKDLHRNFVRLRKKEVAQKAKKENRKSGKRISPEFPISDELAAFMGLDPGSTASRTNALAFVSKYVKENNLNGIEVDDTKGGKKVDGRLINLDEGLSSIFPNLVNSDEHLKFTSIITHLNQHFPEKKQVDAPAPAEEQTA